jgi:hypothetical protein
MPGIGGIEATRRIKVPSAILVRVMTTSLTRTTWSPARAALTII